MAGDDSSSSKIFKVMETCMLCYESSFFVLMVIMGLKHYDGKMES